MNETLKAIVIELTADNVRNHHVYLGGALGLFRDDCFSGSNERTQDTDITVRIGKQAGKTSIQKEKAVLREHDPIRRFFEEEMISEGDLIVIERLHSHEFQLWKASKRGFRCYL